MVFSTDDDVVEDSRPQAATQVTKEPPQKPKLGTTMINTMAVDVADEPEGPETMVFNAEGQMRPLIEVNANNPLTKTTMSTTNTFKMKPAVELVSKKAGTNNPAFSRLPVEDRHLIIANQMQD